MKRTLLLLALLASTRPAAAQPAETAEYYGLDALGSIRISWDANGNVISRKDYAPFGRPLFASASMPNEGFGGQQTDPEFDQSYFHARIFRSNLGRFSTPDSVGGVVEDPRTLNRYAYALDNPISVEDFGGLQAQAADCTWVEVQVEGGLEDTLNCPQKKGGSESSGSSSSFWSLWLDMMTGTVVVEADPTPAERRNYSGGQQGAVAATLVVSSLISPLAKASEAETLAVAAESTAAKAIDKAVDAAEGLLEKAYHYTFSSRVDSILANGLQAGNYATPNGSLGALGAHIELALGGLGRDAVLEIDLAGLRNAGYQIPPTTRVTANYGMPGGGWEIKFPYPIPPQFVSLPGGGR